MPDDDPTLRVTAVPGRARPAHARLARSLRGRGRVRLRASIGLRLGLVALALGLPFLAYVAGNALREAALERTEAKQRALSLARLFAARVDDYVGDMVSGLALAAHGVSATPESSAANDAFLRNIRGDLPRSVHNIGVWTLDGRNVGALAPARAPDRLSVRGDAYFQRAIATDALAVDGPLVSPWDGRTRIVVFARPLHDADGAISGVVTMSTDLHALGWLLDLKGAAPAGTVVALVNAGRITIARNIDPERWIGASVAGVGRASEHVAAPEGVDETTGADGIARIAGFTRTARLPWHVFVGVPRDSALSSARANVAETLAFGTLSLLIGALLAAHVGTRIARPLRRLAYDATLLARGQLSHRTTVAGDDETGVLASTLNRLAQTVEERTRALKDKTAALEDKTAALEARTAELATITANVPVLIAYLDSELTLRFVNDYFRDVFHVAPADVIGRPLRKVAGEKVFARLEPRMREVRAGLPQTFETTFTADGSGMVFLVTCFPDYGDAHEVRGAYVVCQDITRRKHAEEALEASERRLRGITDTIPSMVGYIDRERRYRFNSRYYEAWLGRPLAEITGQRVADVLGAATYASIAANLDRALTGERVDYEVEVRHSGTSRFLRGSYIPDVDASGDVVGVYTSSTDVTPMKEVERQLARLAQKDTLTGLPNRHAFNDGIAAALARSARGVTQVALMFLDVDAFKTINDTLGHAAGDDVLREFARRLQAAVRPTDLVARLAGDEFVIVLEGIHTRDECRFVARKIIAAMRPAFHAGDASLRVTTSIGIAMNHGSATTPEALLKRADSALYAAKGHGRDTYEIAI